VKAGLAIVAWMAVLLPLGTGCALAEDWDSIQAGTGSAYDKLITHDIAGVPLAYFPLTDAPGSTGAADLMSPTMYAAPVDGGVTFTGTAASFDGTGFITLETAGTYAFITGMPPTPMGLGAFTLEAWINPAPPGGDGGTSGGGIDVFGEGSADVGYSVLIQGDEIALGLNESAMNGCGTGGTTFDPGQGFYFVGESDGNSTLAVYVNDSMMTEGCDMPSLAAASMPTTAALLLGSLEGADAVGQVNFVGTISRVAIYDRTLGTDEISEHYMTGGSGP
jgi:hypothetical protein